MIRIREGIEKWKQGLLSEAQNLMESYLADYPHDPIALANLANIYRDRGQPAKALELYDRSLALDPSQMWVQSNRLMTMNYVELDPRILSQAHRGGIPRLTQESTVVFRNRKDEKKRLHVGFISADFRWHSVAFFIFGLFRSLDSEQFEVTCLSENRSEDQMTELLRSSVNGWLDTSAMTDDEFVKSVRRCRCDVLIDLSGHTAYNRALALARRCAPIQISWLGYPTQTGNPSIDYWLTDSIVSATTSTDFDREIPLILSPGFHVYSPPVQDHEVPLYEKSTTEPIVFGCFNHRAKISDDRFMLWVRILEKVEDSILFLKGRSFNDAKEVARVRCMLETAGLRQERVKILGRSETTMDHLNAYQEVDVALDTFPYTGTTTTCEALWMGVPVVSQMGLTHASRVSASLLSQLGESRWVARDEDDYCDKAIEIALNRSERIQFKKEIRQRMKDCGLTDATLFTGKFEAKLREVWARYCLSN